MSFEPEDKFNPGDYWRVLGMLIPGEVDHVAIYIGPNGRCVEACAKGVYTFDLVGNKWVPEKMFKFRGNFKDHLIGIVYPLYRLNISDQEIIHIRQSVADYCLAQAKARKPYNLNLLNPDKEDAFYCAQLAYKAYLPHGINLNTGQGVPDLPNTDSIVFPQEIWSGFHHLKAE